MAAAVRREAEIGDGSCNSRAGGRGGLPSSSPAGVSYSLHPEAERQLSEAAAFYQSQAGGSLASAFLNEFVRVATLLALNPEMGRPVRDGLRIHPVRRFPYALVYRVAPTAFSSWSLVISTAAPTTGVVESERTSRSTMAWPRSGARRRSAVARASRRERSAWQSDAVGMASTCQSDGIAPTLLRPRTPTKVMSGPKSAGGSERSRAAVTFHSAVLAPECGMRNGALPPLANARVPAPRSSFVHSAPESPVAVMVEVQVDALAVGPHRARRVAVDGQVVHELLAHVEVCEEVSNT